MKCYVISLSSNLVVIYINDNLIVVVTSTQDVFKNMPLIIIKIVFYTK